MRKHNFILHHNRHEIGKTFVCIKINFKFSKCRWVTKNKSYYNSKSVIYIMLFGWSRGMIYKVVVKLFACNG